MMEVLTRTFMAQQSVRVALAVPPKLHEQLKAWADYEGRPITSLCMYLIENSLRQAQKDGLAPSFSHETVDGLEKWEPKFLGDRFETTAPKEKKVSKKEALMEALRELMED